MRDVLGTIQQVLLWTTWLLGQAWQWCQTYAPRLADTWHEGPLWKQISLLAIAAALGFAVFALGRKVFRGARRLVGGAANVLMILLAVAPTIIILFLAAAGGLWIATTF